MISVRILILIKREICPGLYIEVMTGAVNRLGMKPVFETSNWMGCS